MNAREAQIRNEAHRIKEKEDEITYLKIYILQDALRSAIMSCEKSITLRDQGYDLFVKFVSQIGRRSEELVEAYQQIHYPKDCPNGCLEGCDCPKDIKWDVPRAR